MNPADLDVFVAQVAALQNMQMKAHAALQNWGAWSRDRGVGPRMARQHLLDQHDGDLEGYGEDGDVLQRVEPQEAAKMERKEETYEEKPAVILDERIHGSGGLPASIRMVLRVAYIDGGPDVGKWWSDGRADCAVPGHFLERLEAGLKFVGRFL